MAAEVSDRELAAIALELAEPLRQDADVDGTRRQPPGLVVAHLDELEPPCDLGEAGVNHQLPRRTQGPIRPAGQVGEVGDHSG